MHKPVFTAITLTALISGQAMANEKLTLVLDWYINPDHAPIMVAEQIGAFKAQGLDVKIVPPSDPALPPRLVAAGQADLAITYQPQVHFFADEGLPLVRVGTLINSPLNTIIALDKRIKTPADLKGKKVGYSVSGIEQATLATMAQHDHIDPQSIKLINVNFQLTSALLAGQVDAVIGGYRNIEALELKLQGKDPQVMNVEDYGVPAYDELVIVANRDEIHAAKIKKFLVALQEGVAYLRAHPQETWQAFAAAHPELNTELNQQAWQQTAPLFADHPAALDKARYEAYEQFLYNNKLVKKITPLTHYAVELD
ncbi:ABC transporter substrate-binding protein [Raoultella ornithinolytica]|uniref:ABC transporter substrate-binding protein n=1 Tax=Raoultella ornithinolytica TaxID=54291 RepID=UPI0005CB0E89|nr:ABC transporter substrate-binding protein [Raoultella ornithinolytica]EKX4890895.1 ABC transporter substrate-binding protein [Raoultella ornithinolytica]KIZ46798.1 thiamine biosynthesis protein [Raoultella ornithinolytica]HEC2561421.1 ABC transporter substrate-binding protein [Raoultella ornithinolytica]